MNRKEFWKLYLINPKITIKLLRLAVLKNNLDMVKFIFEEDRAYQHVTASKKSYLKSLFSIAAREGHKDIAKILCEKYEGRKLIM